jgi:hypothetical protein
MLTFFKLFSPILLEKYLLGVKLLVFIDKKETNPRTIYGILGPAKARA